MLRDYFAISFRREYAGHDLNACGASTRPGGRDWGGRGDRDTRSFRHSRGRDSGGNAYYPGLDTYGPGDAGRGRPIPQCRFLHLPRSDPFSSAPANQAAKRPSRAFLPTKLSAGNDALARERLRDRRGLRSEPLNTLPGLGLRKRTEERASPTRVRSVDLRRVATGSGAFG